MDNMGKGFAGVISRQKNGEELLESIVGGVSYRGKVKTASLRSGTIHLAQVGNEPMILNGGPRVLSHTFGLSESLREVASSAIKEPNALNKISGHFAIGVVKPREGRVILTRDIFGTRPLFYLDEERFFAFSSDLYSLTRMPGYKRRPNHRFLKKYVIHNRYDKLETRYKRVKRVESGHVLEYDVNRNSIYTKKWKKPRDYSIGESDSYRLFRERLEEIVSKTVDRSKACIQVSGGLDSASVASIASEVEVDTLEYPKYYSITYKREVPEESRFLDVLEKKKDIRVERYKYGSIKDKTGIDSDYLPKDIFYSPFYIMHVPALKKLFGGGRGTVLTGVGGDIITGSNFYKKKYYYYLKKKRFDMLAREAIVSLDERWFFRFLSYFMSHGLYTYLKNITYGVKNDNEKGNFPFLEEGYGKNINLEKNSSGIEGNNIRKSIYSSLTRTSETLEAMDKISALSGLEIFHPLRDRKLFDIVLSVDVSTLFSPGKSKKMLKKSLTDYLPEALLSRRTKSGYDLVYRDELKRYNNYIKKILFYGSYSPNYVDEHKVRLFLEHEQYERKIPSLNSLWRLIKVSHWYESQYFE